MAPITHRSRIHLLAAKEAPTIVILQRKRAKLFHVVTIDTQTHQVTEGSWFRGVIYGLQCDVSFDGKYMAYLAMGKPGPDTWSGLCRLPWLKTLVDVEGVGRAWGGGYFPRRDVFVANGWWPDKIAQAVGTKIPFKISEGPFLYSRSGDLGLIYERWSRDGFKRLGPNWGEEETFDGYPYRVVCTGDDGWGHRPSCQHPRLEVRYLGFFDSGARYAFSLDEFPAVVEGASWVTWDSTGNLWVARPGVVEQFTLEDLPRGTPSFSLDVDRFEPPARVDAAP
jgi:hypothetical protein